MASLCVLATVGAGEPQARVLVLREVAAPRPADAPSASRLGVFINASSPKFRQLAQSQTVALVVYLPSLSVQYRLRSDLQAIPSAIVRDNWLRRPPIPKRMDWLYEDHPQGAAVASRERLVRLLDRPVPDAAPDSARGYYLLPLEVERLDLGRRDGVHDRRRYTLRDTFWAEEVLIP